MIETVLPNVDETEDTKLLVGALGLTIMAAMVLVVVFLLRTKKRLNWYEQNVLEMAVEAQHVRCKAFNRMDTDDDTRSIDRISLQDSLRKQSRIMPIRAPSVPINLPKGDLSELFHIPRIMKSRSSMFANPTQEDFDRGLYQCQEESTCSKEMGDTGSLKIALAIDNQTAILYVKLLEAVDMPLKRESQEDGGGPNPFFKLSLELPDGAKTQYVSKKKENTTSPIMNEEFCFQLQGADLTACRLGIEVFDYDPFAMEQSLGYCNITLGRISVSDETPHPSIFWVEILPNEETQEKGFGEVLFSLAYLSTAQRLMINIFRVRKLKCPFSGGSVSIRVNLIKDEKCLKKKKTSSKKNANNLQFSEALAFSIPKNTLVDMALEIEVLLESGTFGFNQTVIARFDLPLHRAKDLWRSIIHEEKYQARWYPLEEP